MEDNNHDTITRLKFYRESEKEKKLMYRITCYNRIHGLQVFQEVY